jgi:LPXTG-motif cell wall-anchored protein
MIAGTQKVPAKLQGQLNVYKQLWAGKDSLNASLADANKAHKAALTDKGTYQKQYNFYRLDAKGLSEKAAQGQKMLDEVAAKKAALNVALLNVQTAATNRANAKAALQNAWTKLDNDRVTYGVPTQATVNSAEAEANTASEAAATALAKTHQNVAGPRYYQASASVENNQKALNSASAARPAAVDAVTSATTKLNDAKAALNSASGSAAIANAKKNVAEAQQALDDAQGELGDLDAIIAHANDEIARSQKIMAEQLAANGGRLQQLMDEYNAAAAKATAAQKNYNTLKTNLENAQKPLASMDAAAAALATAKANQAAAQKAYDEAVAKLNSLTGNTDKPSTDKPSTDKPSTDKPSTDKPSTGDDATNNKDQNAVKPNFTGKHNGNYYVNGKQVTEAQYKAHIAAQSVAQSLVAKGSTKLASAAATAKDSQSLPQTGNENSAAVVALGAVSAMFGLGLAAKKREF